VASIPLNGIGHCKGSKKNPQRLSYSKSIKFRAAPESTNAMTEYDDKEQIKPKGTVTLSDAAVIPTTIRIAAASLFGRWRAVTQTALQRPTMRLYVYTSIAHDKGIEATKSLLEESELTTDTIQLCLDLLRLILYENYFLYEDTFYNQQRGTAMGSNVAPAYANAFMNHFEVNYVFTNLLFQQHVICYHRFIDDIFLIWTGTAATLNTFYLFLNSIHPELQFTIHQDKDSVPFLDTLVNYRQICFANQQTAIAYYTTLAVIQKPPETVYPRSQFNRVTRIVSETNTATTRLETMAEKVHSIIRKHWPLLARAYPNIDSFNTPTLMCTKRATNLRDRLPLDTTGTSFFLLFSIKNLDLVRPEIKTREGRNITILSRIHNLADKQSAEGQTAEEEEGTGRKTLDLNKEDPGKHTQMGGKNISKAIHSEEIGTKQNPLNCMLANARSLTNKMEELEAEISTGDFDIVGITETWLDESYDWAVNLQGYSLFRKDRKNRRGGGVCLYVKSCLKSTLREDISEGNEDVESIWVEIHGGKNGNKILIGVCYKPPNITETMESLLLKQIDEAATHNEVLVMGDFNYPDINWESETCETHKGNRFLLITKKNYLSQLVQNPTRGAALLDLILSNRPDRITNLQVVGHLGNSDHNIVQFHLSFTRGTCQGVTKTLNFRKSKFDQLRDALNLVDWDNILRNKNTDNKWEMFKNILNRQCKRFIPCGNKRTRNRKNPMWLNKEVRQAINSKKKAFALLKQDGTIEALKKL
ncbi:unnamed protein product, partial [Ranitomeya imitator]